MQICQDAIADLIAVYVERITLLINCCFTCYQLYVIHVVWFKNSFERQRLKRT